MKVSKSSYWLSQSCCKVTTFAVSKLYGETNGGGRGGVKLTSHTQIGIEKETETFFTFLKEAINSN